MAQPTGDQYAPTNQQITPSQPTAQAAPSHPTHPGSTFLPLTGLDLAVLAVCAVILLGGGLALKRLSPNG